MTVKSVRFSGIALTVLTCAVAALAEQVQPDPGTTASFEVASVKPNKNGTPNAIPPVLPNGGYSASNVALKSVIANAYQVRIFQIEGGPDWLAFDRFDILARGREGTPDGLRPAMLRALLAERFKLVAHFETKEQQVYSLVLARSDGRLGPRLKPSAPDTKPGLALPSVGNGIGRIAGTGVLIDAFAGVLANDFRQMVINRTDLKGRFDIDLQFTPGTSAVAAPEFPSIFTAVQEQLGLRLQPDRAPVPVLVIDSVERPTPD
jgi:uncharacterized protein (TIGR03435 family)